MASPKSTSATDDIRNEISCWDCVNAMFFCVGPAHQFDRYYKDGRFDSCAKKVDELTLCMKLKVAGPEETKRVVESLLKREAPTTEGIVWKRRQDQPADGALLPNPS